MAVRAEAARPAPRPRTGARPRPAARRAPRHGVAGVAVWIGVLALLLAGIVALNVAVLRLNVQLDGLADERAHLRAERARLHSQLASAASSPYIFARAERQLGLVLADPAQTKYVDLAERAR